MPAVSGGMNGEVCVLALRLCPVGLLVKSAPTGASSSLNETGGEKQQVGEHDDAARSAAN